MKLVGFWAIFLAVSLAVAPARAARMLRRAQEDKKAITKVVHLLEEMLEQSQAEGVKEKEAFAKHKCYCDQNQEEKTSTVARLNEEISLLESRIEKTQASTAILSQEVAALAKELEENKEELDAATALRTKENEAFVDKDKDLKNAIGQMQAALGKLTEIGGDQTLGSDASHDQFMAKDAQLVALKGFVQQALLAASAFDASPKQEKSLDAFLQAPSYSSSSGEVVGILKQMMETFQANLDEATKQEEVAQTSYDKLKITLEDAAKTMTDSHDEKQGLLSANDGGLAGLKEQLETAEKEREDASTFLEKLDEICTLKAKEFEARKKMRVDEEAAISQAIAILNSDAAFATFGKVSATSTGGTGPMFVQLASDRRSPKASSSLSQRRQQVRAVLRKAAHGRRFKELSHIVGLLEAENPFKTVLEEIKKMISLIEKEGEADQEKFDWCNNETSTKGTDLEDAKGQITTLEAQIMELKNAIQDPKMGLIATIKATEESLASNREDQKSQTESRTKDNLLYQEDIRTLVEAEDLLSKAVGALKKYYEEALASAGSMLQKRASQKSKEDPAPPETWDSEYSGQKESGTGAIGMIEYILDETHKEELAAHGAEDESQQSYEGSMQSLKEQEAELGEVLSTSQLQLADKKEELLGKEEDMKATVGVKEKTEAYLESIAAGCDFIVDNLESRKASRKEEKDALDTATKLLTESPAYTKFEMKAEVESQGDCADTCAAGKEQAGCQACLAGTSVPGYCAGHPDTPGC